MVGNIPNLLTLSRILILPFFVAALIYEKYNYALVLFAVAAVTDLLDGLAARMLKQITDFGKILDPVADKFLLITSFVLMSNIGLIPKWLTIIVITKDIIIVTGCFILYFLNHSLTIEPVFLGKLASTLQFFLIGLVLLSCNVKYGFPISPAIYLTVAVITGLAGIHYVYRGFKMANSKNAWPGSGG